MWRLRSSRFVLPPASRDNKLARRFLLLGRKTCENMATKRNVAWQTPINLTWRQLSVGQCERPYNRLVRVWPRVGRVVLMGFSRGQDETTVGVISFRSLPTQYVSNGDDIVLVYVHWAAMIEHHALYTGLSPDLGVWEHSLACRGHFTTVITQIWP